MLCTSSGYNLLVLTIERYLAITKPLSYDENVMRDKLCFILPLVWISGFIFMIPTIFVYEIEDGYCFYTVGNWKMKYAILLYSYFAVASFLFPGITMVILYIKMMTLLYKGRRVQKELCKTNPNTLAEAQRNIFITCFILVTLYMTCWLWMEAVIIRYIYQHTEFPKTLYFSSNISILVNSVINPFIYTIRYKEFQEHIKLLFLKSKQILKLKFLQRE